ncbi:hypothetical protein [Occallatibacter riparius]|uniref:RiboL-PSP-HEPN domain-containing protein n=1 Tax=Occallatibacter riparius TaxID=1002689 RepID=A0A9J7BTP9_9BACT|nr:hypothetical protein [Occallatibacter riparius]UWZ85969.1 hypothetical protein MOP44_08485 [Occallatibacter riparius]
MSSRRFKQLEKRLGELRTHFLPSAFDPLGIYSPSVHDLTRGYQVLAHAEIEAFIEDRTSEVVARAQAAFRNRGRCGEVLTAILAFHYVEQPPVGEKTAEKIFNNNQDHPRAAVELSCRRYLNEVKGNNGIKQKDVLNLFLPIGLKPTRINAAWLRLVDAFGAARGLIAHAALAVQRQPDPKTVFEEVERIKADLRTLDEDMAKLR